MEFNEPWFGLTLWPKRKIMLVRKLSWWNVLFVQGQKWGVWVQLTKRWTRSMQFDKKFVFVWCSINWRLICSDFDFSKNQTYFFAKSSLFGPQFFAGDGCEAMQFLPIFISRCEWLDVCVTFAYFCNFHSWRTFFLGFNYREGELVTSINFLFCFSFP